MYTQLKKEILNSGSTNWYFSIEKQDFGGNTVYRQYNDFPDEKEYLEIKSITFSINSNDENQIDKKPEFLEKLLNLKSLTIPIDWLTEIYIPINIEVLKLTSPIKNFNNQHEFPDGLILNDLKYLSIPELVKSYVFNAANFPNLEWLDYDLAPDKNTNNLIEFSKLKGIKHLVFNHSKKLDIFPIFYEHKIESLELFACIGKEFMIDKILGYQNLKSLYINNISVVFDCSILLNLENLEELNLLNIKKVVNTDALLKHKNLKKLHVKYCSNPFKEIGKDVFINNGFESLEINFA